MSSLINGKVFYETMSKVVLRSYAKEVELLKTLGWKTIPQHPMYMANDNGEIYSLTKKRTLVLRTPEKDIAGVKEGWVYIAVNIRSNDGTFTTIGVHRLVAMAFLPFEENWESMEVNHIDGNKHNNTSSNLEWVTRSQIGRAHV